MLLLCILVTAIAWGDAVWPYGAFRTAPAWPKESRTWEGVVTQPPRVSESGQRLVVRLVDDERLVMLTALTDTTARRTVTVGDVVTFHTRVEVPRNAGNPGEMDYAAYLRHQGIEGQAFCPASQWRDVGRSATLLLHERMLIVRDGLVANLRQQLQGEALAIATAMTLGDRTHVDQSLRELYSRSGVSHLLALSGLHLSILFSLLALVVSGLRHRWGWVGERWSGVLLLMGLWPFVWLAGLPVSLVRAAVMCSIVTLITLLRRKPPTYHSLVLALVIMLLWNPYQLFDVGLQLSVVAVAAIIGVTHLLSRDSTMWHRYEYLAIALFPLGRRLRNLVPDFLWCLFASSMACRVYRGIALFVAVSIVAQLATMPLVLHYFGRVSLVGLLTSLMAIPAAYGILFGTIAYLLIVPLRAVIASALTLCIEVLHDFMRWTSSLPCATLEMSITWLDVAVLYGVAGWLIYCFTVRRLSVLLQERHRRWMAYIFRTSAVAAGVVCAVIGTERLLVFLDHSEPRIIVYNRHAHSEIHVVSTLADSVLAWPSQHRVGDVLLYADRRVAIMDHRLPWVADISMPPPLAVDVILMTHGAQGHLADALLRYRPTLVVLDGCLSPYYRERFAAEAAALSLPVYDVREEGALVLTPSVMERYDGTLSCIRNK